MRTLVLTLLLAFNITSIIAQEYQPFPTESASWKVMRCWYFFPGGWHDEYEITLDGSDTMYEGNLFYNLYIKRHESHGIYDSIYPSEYFGGIRENNKQVFIFQKWASVDTSSHLVYDFTSTQLGDTIYTTCLAGTSNIFIGHVIAGIDSVLIGTKYHRRLHLHDPSNTLNTEYWIEGVGSSWGLPFASFWSITDNSYDLTCYYEQGVNLYWNLAPTFSYCSAPLPVYYCDTLPSQTHDDMDESAAIVIYPNPTNSLVYIDRADLGSPVLVYIYDTRGAIVLSRIMNDNECRLDVSALSEGVYYLQISTGARQYHSKILVER